MNERNRWVPVLALVVGLTLSSPSPAMTPPAQSATAPQLVDKKVGDKYPTVALHKGKVGADRSQGVIYLDATQREERRLVIRGGLVYDHVGRPIVDTKSKHRNQNNYVMDAA